MVSEYRDGSSPGLGLGLAILERLGLGFYNDPRLGVDSDSS